MLSLAMIVVGLTGGLGVGKTTIAGLFQDCGATIIDADQIARDVVKPGLPAWKDIKKEFGATVFHTNSTVNRPALARIVFEKPSRLMCLQRIIHPRVAREQAKRTKAIAQASPHAVIIYDAPLLIEAGAHKRMDHVIVVKADRSTQTNRVATRDGLTKTEAMRRIKQQMPLRQKLHYADTVLDGTLPRSQLRPIIRSLYRTYQQEARQQRLE